MHTYDEMVDSGVAYLGMIPNQWKLTRSSMLFSENKTSNNQLKSLKPLKFRFGEIVDKDIEIDEKTKEEIKRYTVVDKNDIMVNGLNLNYDFVTQRVAIVRERGCITPAYISLRARSNILPTYACYLLKALDGRKVLNGWGTGIRLTLNFPEFKKTRLPEPPIEIQQKVVDFLDTETTKIDNLIAKQERLLELLEEKRRATITRTVTRGLGLKGNADWKEERLRYLCTLSPFTDNQFNDMDSVSFYPMESIGNNGSVNHSELRDYKDVKNGYTTFKNGDVVLAKVTPCFENYKGALMSEIASEVGFGTTEIFVLRPNTHIIAEFLYHITQSSEFNKYLTGGMRGTGGLKRVVPEELKNYKIRLPHVSNQQEIIDYINDMNTQNQELKNKVKHQIKLLHERRTSLISHAVTGKIKI